jgi:pilus assembly protein Flp/PilA
VEEAARTAERWVVKTSKRKGRLYRMTNVMFAVMTWVSARFDLKNERGATAVEYGIMVALIAAVIIGVVAVLGGQIHAAFCSVTAALPAGSCPT